MHSSIFLSSLALVTPCVLAIQDSFPEGYTVGPMHWSGEFKGQTYNITGTVQDLVAHFQCIDPTYEVPDDDTSLSPLEKRDANTICYPVSGQDWLQAVTHYINDGISYLKNLNKNIDIPARYCGRISCSYKAAIYWCNDNDRTITQGSAWLAQHAVTIVESCATRPGGNLLYYVCGQNFDPGAFNIIVRQDYDNC